MFGQPAPPDFEPPTPTEGTILQVFAESPIRIEVQAPDPCEDDVVTLSAAGLPAGADFVTTPGNSAAGRFDWVAQTEDIVDHVVAFEATDKGGRTVETTVVLQVAECFALIASAPGGISSRQATASRPICPRYESLSRCRWRLLGRSWSAFLRRRERPMGAAAVGASARTPVRVFAQVVMWNPGVFPGQSRAVHGGPRDLGLPGRAFRTAVVRRARRHACLRRGGARVGRERDRTPPVRDRRLVAREPLASHHRSGARIRAPDRREGPHGARDARCGARRRRACP